MMDACRGDDPACGDGSGMPSGPAAAPLLRPRSGPVPDGGGGGGRGLGGGMADAVEMVKRRPRARAAVRPRAARRAAPWRLSRPPGRSSRARASEARGRGPRHPRRRAARAAARGGRGGGRRRGAGADPRARRPRGGRARRRGARRAGRRGSPSARSGSGPLEPLLRRSRRRGGDGLRHRAGVGRARRAAGAHGRRASRARRDLREAIERILAPLGRRVDEAEPLCDARLPDGSRVNVVIPPLALDGPALTIRRFRRRGFTPEDLVANGTLTAPLLRLPRARGAGALHVLVCGGTGLGQDDDAERAVGVHRRGRARGDDRGRGRAVAAPAARRPARGAAAEPRGPRRGHDPPARAQRAADAPRPDRRRRGARAARRSTC